MEINMNVIRTEAEIFADNLLSQKVKSGHISIDMLRTIHSPKVLGSEFGPIIVEGLITGAILSYHDQLHSKLLELGIDIGEIVNG